jgi:hypothetical protein
MKENEFNFPKWINDAFVDILKKTFKTIYKHNSTLGNSFYITFMTFSEGIKMPAELLKEYPDVMTIVIEHQFDRLDVHKDGFEVELSFKGVPSHIFVPWTAILSFSEKNTGVNMVFNNIPNIDVHVSEGETYLKNKHRAKSKNSENLIFFPKDPFGKI